MSEALLHLGCLLFFLNEDFRFQPRNVIEIILFTLLRVIAQVIDKLLSGLEVSETQHTNRALYERLQGIPNPMSLGHVAPKLIGGHLLGTSGALN